MSTTILPVAYAFEARSTSAKRRQPLFERLVRMIGILEIVGRGVQRALQLGRGFVDVEVDADQLDVVRHGGTRITPRAHEM